MINPHDIMMEVISNVLFDKIIKVSNMRCFKIQEIAIDHRRHEKEMNKEYA